MSVWVAGATVAVGAYSASQAKKSGDKASKSQDKATKATTRLEEDKLDFAYEQYDEQLARYDDWRAIYGPIEENLGDFYNSLTPETYAAAGLDYNHEAFQTQRTQALQNVAQRGLDSSGILSAIDVSLGVSKAEADAKTRIDAPFRVAAEKTGFLNSGKGGPTMPPTGNVGNVLANSNTPQALQNEANLAANSANSQWGSAGNLLSTGINYYARNSGPTANQGSVAPDTMSMDPNPNAQIQLPG